jgi:uncharacterized membrane protein
VHSRWLGFAAALVAVIASLVFWPRLPPDVVTHWNLRGEPDGTSTRLMAALLGPGAMLGLTVLFRFLPRIDPRGRNYPRFQRVYWLVVNALILWVLVFHVALLASGAGAVVNLQHVIAGCSAVMMLVLGNSLGRIQPNWFMGIRTPWTLESPEVWRRTHRAGAWLLVGSGVITAAALFVPGVNPLGTALVATLVAALVSVVLSLVYWFQEKRA